MIADLQYLRLSYRKDRRLFIALPAVFVFTLALPLLSRDAGRDLLRDVQNVLGFWAILGLPVLGAVLGGSSGAEARADAEIESALPLSPERRTLGRLAVVFAALAVFAAVMWSLESLLARSTSWSPPAGTEVKFLVYCMYGSLSAFAAGYASESSAIGATGGLLVIVLMTGMLGPIVLMETLCSGSAPFWETVWGIAASGVAAAVASVILTARRRVWRRVSDLEHGALQAAVAAWLAIAVVTFSGLYLRAYWSRLELFLGFEGAVSLPQRQGRGGAGPAWPLQVVHRAPRGGAYASSLNGRVVWIASDGTVTEVAPARLLRPTFAKRAADLVFARGGDLFHGRDGQVRLLRPDGKGAFEIWRGPEGRPMTLERSLPAEPAPDALVEGPDGLYVLSDYPAHQLAHLDGGKPLAWKPLPWRGSWSWRSAWGIGLPGGVHATIVYGPLHRRSRGQLVTIDAEGQRTQIGTVPAPVGDVGNYPSPVRLDDKHAWYVEGTWLTERQLNGRLIASWPLPGYYRDLWPRLIRFYQPTDQGLLVRTSSGVSLVDWQGRVVRTIRL